MITSDELSGLRSEGNADDVILEKYKKYSPQEAGDIDSLLKEGNKPSVILDKLVQYHNQPRSVGKYVQDLIQSPMYGAKGVADDLASTTKQLGAPGAASTLNSMGEAPGSLVSKDYRPANVKALSPSTWGDIPQLIGESLPGMASTIGAGAAGAGLATLMGASAPVSVPVGLLAAGGYGAYKYLGRQAEARAANNGRSADNVTTGDLVGALPGAVAGGALDATGLKLGGLIGKGAGVTIGDAIANNALTGMASSAVNQAGATLGTNKGLNVNPEHLLDAGLGAGVTAGTLKAAGVVKGAADEALQKYHSRNYDPTFSGPLAAATESAPGYTVAERVGNARDTLMANLAPIEKSSAGNLSILPPEVQARVAEHSRAIQKGTIIDPSGMEVLKSDLSHPVLNPLLSHLGQLNESNKLGKTTEGVTDWFANNTGLTSKAGTAGLIDGSLKKVVPYVTAGAITSSLMHFNPAFAAVGVLGPTVVRAGLRGVDRALGLNNPMQRWQDRFSGLQKLNEAASAQLAPDPQTPKASPAPNPDPVVDLEGAQAALTANPGSVVRPPTPPPVQPPVPPSDLEGAQAALRATQLAQRLANTPPPAPQQRPAPPSDLEGAMAALRASQAAQKAQQATTLPPAPQLPPEGSSVSRADFLKLIGSGVPVAAPDGSKVKMPEAADPKSITKTTSPSGKSKVNVEEAPVAPEPLNTTKPVADTLIDGGSMHREMMAADINKSHKQYQDGVKGRVAARDAIYDSRIEGLSPEAHAKWDKLVEPNDDPKSVRPDNLRDAANHQWNSRELAKAGVASMLSKHFEGHPGVSKFIKDHLGKQGYFNTWGRPKKAKKDAIGNPNL